MDNMPFNKDQARFFLKDSIRLMINWQETDQSQQQPMPPLQKPYDENDRCYDLPSYDEFAPSIKCDLLTAIKERRSIRSYTEQSLTLKELSFLLWATQGFRQTERGPKFFRHVPSAGCRHAFETYLAIFNVESLPEGIYRYLPVEHKLLFMGDGENLANQVYSASLGQGFTAKSAVTFFWSAIPYRMEWRYSLAAHKVLAIDVGHVCQNLYLACEAIHAGTCAIAAYDQEKSDELFQLDGEEEFIIYLAPVGKCKF